MNRRRKLILAGAAGAAILSAPVLVAWSGIYSVAASEGHLAVVDWFLRFGMRNSVKTHSWSVEEPQDLEDPDRVVLGAGHFHDGCAPCHGAPGRPPNLSDQRMLPAPPSLSAKVSEWKERELFWITKHGIKYTGMPGWTAQERDDEVWAIVAFLKKLPEMQAKLYRELALGLSEAAASGPRLTAGSEAVSTCERCHGADGRLPRSKSVPILYGQTTEFLVGALNAYADGTRKSGFMQPIAAGFDAEERKRLAAYYAGEAPTPTHSRTQTLPTPDGKTLAEEGRPRDAIPACNACHGPAALPTYPRLAGQNAKYVAGQLHLWQRGGRSEGPSAGIMAPIARRLTATDIDAVSSYFESLPVEPLR